MDKHEYKIMIDEMELLIKDNKYKEAVDIADMIDWRNVKSSKTLCMVSDLYKKSKRYEDSRDVLLVAYQRNPGGRMILYSLCELSIKLGDIVSAHEFLKEYSQVAPKDPGKYVLRYKFYTASGVGIDERIQVLEELQLYECRERWMYELAYLYHMQGFSDKCIDECDQIVIYFGEGKYVLKALELKATYCPLSAEQDALLTRLTTPKYNEVLVKDMDVSKFNTIDLEKELASSMAEVFYSDNVAKEAEYVDSIKAESVVNESTEQINENEETQQEDLDEYSGDTTVIPNLYENVKEYISEKEEEGISYDTRVINSAEVETALESEPAVSRTVLPSGGRFDGMREILPQGSKGSAINFPSYDDMVSLEGDGQISFNIPDQEIVEKQITGQISIEDVLLEWERLRSASEKTWRENMERKVKQQTSELLKDFEESSKNGLLEQLESEVEGGSFVELTMEESERLNEEGFETVLVPELEITVSEVDAQPEQVSENDDSLSEADTVEEEKTEENNDAKDIREIVLEDELDAYLMAFAEASEARDIADGLIQEVVTETTDNVICSDNILPDSEFIPEEKTDMQFMPEENPASEEGIVTVIDEDPDTVAAVLKAEAEYAEAEENKAEADESVSDEEETVDEEAIEETISEPEPAVTEADVVESDNTEEINEPETDSETEEVEEEKNNEDDELAEGEANEEESEQTKEPELDEAEDEAEEPFEKEAEPEVRESGFTKEQEERFESYIQTEYSREQLKEAIEGLSMRSSMGNIIIGSEDVDSAIDLAKAFIMEITSGEEITGKVAKIKASTLNAKEADETLSKLYEGALIIQDAHELRRETLDAIRRATSSAEKRMLIILTVAKRARQKFVMDNRDMLESFTVSFDIEALTNRELVEYARAYAYRKEYTIDDMGTLALHTRIEGKQTIEHSVTVTEVKAMINEAISKAKKKNAKHFFDVLLGKRYDENDMVVLKEKDFAE